MSGVLVLSHAWRKGAEFQPFKACVEHTDDETRRRMMGHGDIAMTRRFEDPFEKQRKSEASRARPKPSKAWPFPWFERAFGAGAATPPDAQPQPDKPPEETPQ